MFDKTELPTLGTTTLLTLNPKTSKQSQIRFVIVNNGLQPLLGAPTLQHLNLMSVNTEHVMSLDVSRNSIVTQFNDVFVGEKKLQEKTIRKASPRSR